MLCCLGRAVYEFSDLTVNLGPHKVQQQGQTTGGLILEQIPAHGVDKKTPNSLRSEQEQGVSALFTSQHPIGSSSPASYGCPNAFWNHRISIDDKLVCDPEDLLADLTDLKRLGKGGFGYVFQARWCHADVAVKFLATSKDHDGSSREGMARREAVLTEGLRHPNIIQTFQSRRGTTTQAWINKVMSSTTPTLEKRGSSSTTEKVLTQDETMDPNLSQDEGPDYDSDDGYGAPDKSLQSNVKPMSIQEVMTLVQPKVNGNLTVIIMEMADKGTLEWARQVKLFNTAAAIPTSRKWRQFYRAMLRTMREVAQGIHTLHQMDIIHCDLKPSNVLLKSSRQDVRGFTAAICDFGLSRFAPLVEIKTPEKACGTLLYMAPERLNGFVCKASDIYSFGIMLYEIANGVEPFSDMLTRDIQSGVAEGRLRPPWPELHMPELRPLYIWCTEHDPSNRPCASEVVHELINIESELRKRALGPESMPRV